MNASIDPCEALTSETRSYDELVEMDREHENSRLRLAGPDSLEIAVQLGQKRVAEMELHGFTRDNLQADPHIPWMTNENLSRLIELLKSGRICNALTLVYEDGFIKGQEFGRKEAAGKQIKVETEPLDSLSMFKACALVRQIPRKVMAKWLKAGGKFCLKSMRMPDGALKGEQFYVELRKLSPKKVETALKDWPDALKSQAGRPRWDKIPKGKNIPDR